MSAFGITNLGFGIIGGAGGSLPQVPLFIFAGESNSGGYADNADLSAGELAARSSVQILNNNSLVFQNLDVGTNNILDHAGFVDNAPQHGLEVGLANLVEVGRITESQVYLLKTGQGGDQIATWATGHPSGYWTKFLARWAAAQSAATSLGVEFVPYVFYSQGINDCIGYSVYDGGTVAQTDPDVWKAATILHLAKIRVLVGANTRIVMTRFDADLAPVGAIAAYNTRIDQIAAADSLTISMSTLGFAARDGNHWSATGFKQMAERFIDRYVLDVAAGTQLATPAISPHGVEIAGSQSVTLTGPVGATLRYTQNGATPRSDSTLYSVPVSISTAQTFKAIAIQQNRQNSAVDTAVFTLPEPITWSTTDATAQTLFLSDSNLTISAVSGSGWRSCRGSVSKSAGKLYWEMKAKTGGGSGNIMMGFGNAGAGVPATYGGNAQYGMAATSNEIYGNGFTKVTNAYLTTITTINTVFQLAIDFTTGRVWVGRNNTWYLSGDPAAGTTPAVTFTPGTVGALFPLFSGFATGIGEWTMQAVSTNQTYSPPTGFSSWV